MRKLPNHRVSGRKDFIMTEFTPIETQEDFDKAIVERLNRQKESYEKQLTGFEDLKSQNATLQQTIADQKSKADASSKSIEDLNKKVSVFEKANLRTKIALEHGLPYELAGRLVGDDEESIAKDADRLAGYMGSNEQPAPLKSTEEGVKTGTDAAYKNLADSLKTEGE